MKFSKNIGKVPFSSYMIINKCFNNLKERDWRVNVPDVYLNTRIDRFYERNMSPMIYDKLVKIIISQEC